MASVGCTLSTRGILRIEYPQFHVVDTQNSLDGFCKIADSEMKDEGGISFSLINRFHSVMDF